LTAIHTHSFATQIIITIITIGWDARVNLKIIPAQGKAVVVVVVAAEDEEEEAEIKAEEAINITTARPR
jgi:hypothetical protein|tara:strand:- start:219 stop:425 length:207 start_codon:yes stop_codon:yes gene_type:complete